MNKKRNRILTPMKATEALKEMGESYSRKEAFLYYGAFFLIAIVIGMLFELKIKYLLVVIGIYILYVPRLMYNHKKQKYELRRFNDINAYMSQMAQSFTSTKQIMLSLLETRNTFSAGKMDDVLDEAAQIMMTEIDVNAGKSKALQHIEDNYNCEKLKNLHEFLLLAEERGGECEKEFEILENVRTAWEIAVSDYRKKLVISRNTSTVLFGLMLATCVFIMNAFPDNLKIIDLELIQIVDTIMLIAFIAFFVLMDNRINESLLKDQKIMTQETADYYFKKIQAEYSDKDRKKHIAAVVIAGITMLAFFIAKPSPIVAAIEIMLLLLVINWPKIMLALTLSTLKTEILKAFPKWLFDVMLLMQRESIGKAIIDSSMNAPPVLKAELKRISAMILRDPNDPDAFMSFLADFNILQIETSMRKLYSLSVGTGGNDDVMNFIIDTNMKLLTDAERSNIETKGDMTELYQFLPLLVVSVGIMIYCAAIMFVSFAQIMDLLQ